MDFLDVPKLAEQSCVSIMEYTDVCLQYCTDISAILVTEKSQRYTFNII
jgi:hypothetical protein